VRLLDPLAASGTAHAHDVVVRRAQLEHDNVGHLGAYGLDLGAAPDRVRDRKHAQLALPELREGPEASLLRPASVQRGSLEALLPEPQGEMV